MNLPVNAGATGPMNPMFMNQPQYQQQMQQLAMQVKGQEEGIKKVKKFLKSYEDLQMTQAPMPQQGQQMQPPGGVGSMLNSGAGMLPDDQEAVQTARAAQAMPQEAAPMSFSKFLEKVDNAYPPSGEQEQVEKPKKEIGPKHMYDFYKLDKNGEPIVGPNGDYIPRDEEDEDPKEFDVEKPYSQEVKAKLENIDIQIQAALRESSRIQEKLKLGFAKFDAMKQNSDLSFQEGKMVDRKKSIVPFNDLKTYTNVLGATIKEIEELIDKKNYRDEKEDQKIEKKHYAEKEENYSRLMKNLDSMTPEQQQEIVKKIIGDKK